MAIAILTESITKYPIRLGVRRKHRTNGACATEHQNLKNHAQRKKHINTSPLQNNKPLTSISTPDKQSIKA